MMMIHIIEDEMTEILKVTGGGSTLSHKVYSVLDLP
jgi:hypothetical protein